MLHSVEEVAGVQLDGAAAAASLECPDGHGEQATERVEHEVAGIGVPLDQPVDGDHWARVRGGRWRALVLGGAERDWGEVTKYGPLTVVFEGVGS